MADDDFDNDFDDIEDLDDADAVELEWDELDWDDLGFEPEDGDRLRDAWNRITRGYESRGDLAGFGRVLEAIGELAGEAVSPETRRQFERLLRDFLVVLRDVLDRAIERLDEKVEDLEIEEIPID